MGTVGTILIGLVILVGILGAVIQVYPSGPVIGGALLVWAIVWNQPVGWIVFAVAAVVLLAATVAKFLLPGRRLVRSGIPNSTLLWGMTGAVVGFFAIPVVGFIIGLVLAVYLAELARLHTHEQAWPATVITLRAVGLSVVIELVAALVASTAWIVGLILI
ncbi:MAG: DUF456 domain-containing protein [Acidipropionibacterium jensenii]|nr:DUF456 domain-containing protein [Actinomyces sp.]MDN6021986.1 DUF456 domain-containing protein [Acidipropionibacterium jensenii]MDN6428973.1 DUF456 domain-containing protein [Propionibacterium sp.]MDN6565753.1 DUF456 domain-containing protein [Actinomyces sp.]MDN6794152.1 DUF456 domain-containing protein [Propionibacterium sp.]